MKLYELAKELNVKVTQLVEEAKKLSYTVSFNSNVSEDLEKQLRAVEIQPTEESNEVGLTNADKFGSFIGLVHTGEKLVSVHIQLTFEQLSKFNPEILGEHSTIFGGQIELNKNLTRRMNDKFVKIFKKE